MRWAVGQISIPIERKKQDTLFLDLFWWSLYVGTKPLWKFWRQLNPIESRPQSLVASVLYWSLDIPISHQRASAILQLMSFNLAICQDCIASWGVTCWERNTSQWWTSGHQGMFYDQITNVKQLLSLPAVIWNPLKRHDQWTTAASRACARSCNLVSVTCSDSDVMASTCDSSNFAFHSSITPERSWMEAHYSDESSGFLGCKQADTKLLFADFRFLPVGSPETSRMWVSRLVFISRFILWEWAFQGFAFLLQLNFLLLHGKGKWTA